MLLSAPPNSNTAQGKLTPAALGGVVVPEPQTKRVQLSGKSKGARRPWGCYLDPGVKPTEEASLAEVSEAFLRLAWSAELGPQQAKGQGLLIWGDCGGLLQRTPIPGKQRANEVTVTYPAARARPGKPWGPLCPYSGRGLGVLSGLTTPHT